MKRTLAVIITVGLAVTGCQSPVNQQAVSQETIEITETQELLTTETAKTISEASESAITETSAGDAAAGGNTLITTADSRIQSVVEDRISEWQQEVGSDHIGIIVMNPQNGEVLAMAGSSEDFCINNTYEPGTIAQVFPAAAALEEGILTGDETFICDGSETFGDAIIRCIRHSGHGELTLEESLIHSCNDAAMQIAAKEGPEVFAKYQELFGFGSKTGIDLTGEADTGNLVLGSGEMDSVSLATNALGQNYNCTMIQMAAAYSSLINGGTYYQPHIMTQIKDAQGEGAGESESLAVRQTISESTSIRIREALYQSVQEGTGAVAAVDGYTIAGKTGIAEKLPRGAGNYLVSFCGFAPADDPQMLVYIVIDTPHTEDQAHSSYASSMCGRIMADILPDSGL